MRHKTINTFFSNKDEYIRDLIDRDLLEKFWFVNDVRYRHNTDIFFIDSYPTIVKSVTFSLGKFQEKLPSTAEESIDYSIEPYTLHLATV